MEDAVRSVFTGVSVATYVLNSGLHTGFRQLAKHYYGNHYDMRAVLLNCIYLVTKPWWHDRLSRSGKRFRFGERLDDVRYM